MVWGTRALFRELCKEQLHKEIVRMANAAKRLKDILDYMKMVKLSTSTVFGCFLNPAANLKLNKLDS